MPYILNTKEEQAEMLAKIGVRSIEDLWEPIPAEVRLKRPLKIPQAMGEIELTQHFARLAARNRAAGEGVCFLGGGAYDHFIPSVVDAVSGRSEFYTAYTPYQAEASQGTLQAVFEYQTLMAELTGMDVSNASMYEGGSSLAEAVLMAMNIGERRGEVLIAESVHPEYRQTLITYLANLHCDVKTLPTPEGFLDPELLKKHIGPSCIAVVVQSPNFFGHLEEVEAVAEIARQNKAISIVSFDPISLGILKRPGDFGVDIAVAEGQGLGTPMGYGGPYLGILCCRQEYVRKMPGRLVGQTTDRNGKRCWVLTLQTREQHIRRDKATSNICTNQGLYALRAAVFLTALGPKGLKETAELCLRKAHYAARQLSAIPGAQMRFDRPFFKEFTVKLPTDVPALLKQVQEDGYFAGLATGRWYDQYADCLTVAVTEKRTKAEIDGLTGLIRSRLSVSHLTRKIQ